MKSDIEIAQSIQLEPIEKIAKKLNISKLLKLPNLYFSFAFNKIKSQECNGIFTNSSSEHRNILGGMFAGWYIYT